MDTVFEIIGVVILLIIITVVSVKTEEAEEKRIWDAVHNHKWKKRWYD
jgi:hypothetical protein